MKRIIVLLSIIFLFTGCKKSDQTDRILKLRQQMLDAQGCRFETLITADYADVVYTFSMECEVDKSGDVRFVVNKPESIAGIAGIINGTEGQLTFDEKVLAFSKLADGQITPVTAPWVLIHTLRGGYIRCCAKSGERYFAIIDDSYNEDALQLDIYFDPDYSPVEAEILWRGRRIVSLQIEGFTLL